MDLRNFLFTGGIVLLALTICGGNVLTPLNNSPIIKRNAVPIPVSLPIYIGQQPVNTGSVYYPYYYYPQTQYTNTGVVYQTPVTSVQYPYYVWPNTYTPTYNPAVPTTPTNTAGGNTGDPNNPKNDAEYI